MMVVAYGHRVTGRRRLILAAVFALILAAAGGFLLLRADRAVTTTAVRVDGVPMLEVVADVPQTGAGVVIAHGFAGSARLMRGFADTLARRGYVVVVPDLAGHGANPNRLSNDDIDRELDAAVSYLGRVHGLAPKRVALLGHSMGAGAVARYAVGHPDIPTTVVLSLPSADVVTAAAPQHLLLLVGQWEFAGFHAAMTQAMDGAVAVGAESRRAVTIPATEHISILFSAQAHQAAADWIDATLAPAPATEAPRPVGRLAPAGLLLAGLLLGFLPLAAVLLPRSAAGPAARPRPRPGVLLITTAAGCALAVAAAQWLPTSALPLAVGGYTAGFFLLVGAGLCGVLLTTWATPRPELPGYGARLIGAAVLLAGYAMVTIAVPLHLGFTHAVPVGPRWWLLPIVAAAAYILLLGAELTSLGRSMWLAMILAAVLVSLVTAAIAGTGPGFILLVAPLLAALFAWHLGWSAWLRRRSAPAWLIALVGAIVVAWPIATTLALP